MIDSTNTYSQACFICNEKRFYQTPYGIWHSCPACNPVVIPLQPYPAPYPIPYPDHPKPIISWHGVDVTEATSRAIDNFGNNPE